VFLSAPLDPVAADDDVNLDDIVDFVIHPTKAFLRQRLGIRLPDSPAELSDELPLALNGLQRWTIGDRMLNAALSRTANEDPLEARVSDVMQAELQRGTLPPGLLGETMAAEIAEAVTVIARMAERDRAGQESSTVDLSFDLGRYRVSGTIADVYGNRIVTATYSVLQPKHRLAAWVRLLALACSGGEDWQAITIGRLRDDMRVAKRALAKTPADPAAILGELLALRSAGLCVPLPVATETSHAYAGTRKTSFALDDAYAKAVAAWTSTGSGAHRSSGDNDDAAIVCVYGPDAPFSVLWDQPIPDGHRWSQDEPTWFGQLAVRLWAPLLGREYVMGAK
jgi:exodeoxyribonuclease V gamma subunit